MSDLDSEAALIRLAESVLDLGQADEQLEVYVARGVDTEVTVFDGHVESLSSASSQGAGIRLVDNGRLGFAYAASLETTELAELVARARDNARFVEADESVALVEPDGVAPPQLDLVGRGWDDVSPDERVALALEVERATRSLDPRVTATLGCSYDDSRVTAAIVSSTGVRASWQRSQCSLVAQAAARDGDETQTGYGYRVGRSFAELDAGAVAADAVQRATRLLGAVQPRGATLTAVLDPRVSSMLVSLWASGLSAEAVIKGRSLFAGRVGEAVGPNFLTLMEDPTRGEALSAARWDSEGLATRPVPLIEAGVVQGYLHNSISARKMDTVSTASAVRGGYSGRLGVGARALCLTPGVESGESIIAGVERGVLVTSMMGLHSGVNPVSGDFSVGIEGLLIIDGAVATPVREATMASSLLRMLSSVTAVGADLEWLPGNAAGQTLAVADVTMGGR